MKARPATTSTNTAVTNQLKIFIVLLTSSNLLFHFRVLKLTAYKTGAKILLKFLGARAQGSFFQRQSSTLVLLHE